MNIYQIDLYLVQHHIKNPRVLLANIPALNSSGAKALLLDLDSEFEEEDLIIMYYLLI